MKNKSFLHYILYTILLTLSYIFINKLIHFIYLQISFNPSILYDLYSDKLDFFNALPIYISSIVLIPVAYYFAPAKKTILGLFSLLLLFLANINYISEGNAAISIVVSLIILIILIIFNKKKEVKLVSIKKTSYVNIVLLLFLLLFSFNSSITGVNEIIKKQSNLKYIESILDIDKYCHTSMPKHAEKCKNYYFDYRNKLNAQIK